MGKTVLITGASQGIGAAMARDFAERGYNVIINYNKSANAAESLCSEIIKKGGSAAAVSADVREAEQICKMLEESPYGMPDIIINNAGVAHYGLLQDMSEDEYNNVMDINVKGVFNTCKAVLPSMIRNQKGTIINISSVWGRRGASCEVVYSASKAAVIGFTRALAKEVGPSGITVNCICPGVIETEMLSRFTLEDKKALCEETPAGRLGKPQEVSAAALFFAENPFITGQILDVSGGFGV